VGKDLARRPDRGFLSPLFLSPPPFPRLISGRAVFIERMYKLLELRSVFFSFFFLSFSYLQLKFLPNSWARLEKGLDARIKNRTKRGSAFHPFFPSLSLFSSPPI